MKRFLRDDVLERVQQLVPLAQEAGISMAQMAVAWVLRNDNVASAIVGATKPTQLEDNVGAVEVTLDDDLVARIDEILDPVVERDAAMTAKLAPRARS